MARSGVMVRHSSIRSNHLRSQAQSNPAATGPGLGTATSWDNPF
jgi:hypothetical protein